MFEKTILENGVRVLTERIPSVRSISIGAWVGVGSRHEHEDEGGICHFIEHMVFKGTIHRRMHHIAQRMENVGGYLNAFTSKEYTCFYARALDEHLPRAIDTVCDLVLYPSLPEKEIEREKDVVIEEMRMYDDTPEDRIFDLVDTVVYPDHAMGRPVIGREDTVRSMTRDGLSGFMDRNFVPNRMVIAVAGNVDHARTVKLVEKVFRKSDRRPVSPEIIPVPSTAPARTLIDQRPVQQAHLVLASRAYHVHDPRRAALSVLNTLLGGGMSSRLNQNIREKYGYCYNIYSYVNLHSDAGDFGVYMGTDAKHIDHAERLIFRELDKLAQKPVSERMLERSKSQVKGGIMLGLESMGSRMMRIGRQELYYDAYFSLDEILEMIDTVTVDDVRSVAEDLFGRDRFSTVRLIPQSA
ncbi:MAG: pitrilysin family protein [Rhodothermales bacterium]